MTDLGKRLFLHIFRLRHLYLPLVLLLCALRACHPLRMSEDFWAFAAVGRWIWDEQEIPRHTLFLWSSSEPWVAHTWMSSLAFFGLASAGEEGKYPYLILGFTMVMTALPFVVIWLMWWRRTGITAGMIALWGLAILVSGPRFQTRPELFSAVFYVLFLVLLAGLTERTEAGPASVWTKRDTWRAGAMLALLVVWANFHGVVAIGVAVLGVTVVCELAQDRLGKHSRCLAALGILALLVLLINPYGIHYWQALVPIRGPMFARITEWQPLWKMFDVQVTIMHGVLLGVALAAWGLNPCRRWAHAAWLVLLAVSFVQAIRMTWLLALTSLAVTAINSPALHPERLWRKLGDWQQARGFAAAPSDPPRALRWLVRVALLAWVVMEMYVRLEKLENMDLRLPGALTNPLKEGGVRFLAEHPIPGHLLNDYENSAYLQWCFGGHPPLMLDLLNAYPDQVLLDYQQIIQAKASGQDMLEKYHINYIFLTMDRTGPLLAPLGTYLEKNPARWVKVYAGFDGMIWVRKVPENEILVQNVMMQRRRWIRTRQPFATVETWERR